MAKTVEERLAALEKRQPASSWTWLRDGMAMASPILLAVLGFWFNQILQEARERIDTQQLEIRRIQAAQSIMTALFKGDVHEAKAMHVLFRGLFAEHALRETLDESILSYLEQKQRDRWKALDPDPARRLSDDELAPFEAIQETAELLVPGAVLGEEEAMRLHVVLISLARGPGKFARLRDLAERFAARHERWTPEIWCSTTGEGFLALTIGRHPAGQARAIGAAAAAADPDDAIEDFYVTPGAHLVARVWPGPDPGETDPCAAHD